MKKARILRRELDLWAQVWQQVETFLDRVEGADDQDLSDRAKVHALLKAARAVEHQRASAVDPKPLLDPVVDGLPTSASSWAIEQRKWRLPGTDELELAVGNLATLELPFELPTGDLQPVLEKVVLPPSTTLFEIRVEKDDRRYPSSNGGLLTLRMPSYPSSAGALGAVGFVPIAEDQLASLFSRIDRYKAAVAPDPEKEPVRKWSAVCAARRLARQAAPASQVPAPPAAWNGQIMLSARNVAGDARLNSAVNLPGGHVQAINQVAASAAASANSSTSDSADLTSAADAIDEEGSGNQALPDLLRSAAAALAGRPAAFRAVDSAARALGTTLAAHPIGSPISPASASQRAALVSALDGALNGLAAVLTAPALFATPVEVGPIGAELDEAVAARAGYPDGSLRILRALESAFVGAWPAYRGWLKRRAQRSLKPALDRFLKPFAVSLRALLQGGATGLDCEGLELGRQTSVGSDILVTSMPASLKPTLDGVIEAGNTALLLHERPAAAVVLGVDKQAGNLALNVAPLKVSLVSAPELPGSPGMVPAPQSLACVAEGVSTEELIRGLAGDPAADGLVQQALGLWSRLALLLGWQEAEKRLSGRTGVAFGGRTVRDASSAPLHNLTLSGKLPARATSFVIDGAPGAYWDLTGEAPEPRMVRPGELILIRGKEVPPDEGQPAGVIQAVIEIDQVSGITGSAMNRLDTSLTGMLSTDPSRLDLTKRPRLLCAPDDTVALITVGRSWQTAAMQGPVTLRQDFSGFDVACLATRRLLPLSLLSQVGGGGVAEPAGVERRMELAAALSVLDDWTRYAR